MPRAAVGKPWETGSSQGRFCQVIRYVDGFPHLQAGCVRAELGGFPWDAAAAQDTSAVAGFYISPTRTEGPEHLSSPWTQSCASWLFGERFWKWHRPLVLRGEMPRGAVTEPREVEVLLSRRVR